MHLVLFVHLWLGRIHVFVTEKVNYLAHVETNTPNCNFLVLTWKTHSAEHLPLELSLSL
jgi:hypothetical protein